MTVWGNTKTGVLVCPGTRYYGQTKQGTYFADPPVGQPVNQGRTKLWRAAKRGGNCIKLS